MISNMSGLGKRLRQERHWQKTKKHQRAAKSVCTVVESGIQFNKECRFYMKQPTSNCVNSF